MKNIYIILTLFLATLFVTSCETYNDFDDDRPTVAGFTFGDLELSVSVGNTINLPPITYFISEPATVDRSFNVIVVDGGAAISPENYSIPASITIPAGERSGGLTFSVTNVSLPLEFAYITFSFEEAPGVTAGKNWIVGLKSN